MELNPTIHGLFQVPIWEVDLGRILAEFKPELLVETRAALVERPAQNRPFSQTTADLPTHYPVYADLVVMLAEIVRETIAATARTVPAVNLPAIRAVDCWALEIVDRACWDFEASQLSIFHQHPGSTFSSVLFLDAGKGEDDPGGTIFKSPITHADPRLMLPMTVVPWATDHLIVFPSWLVHGPARPPLGGNPRLTVATDFLT